MGAGHSARASWPPPGARRKHILALLRINGHATGPTADIEVSQASEVICEILEHVFSFLTASDCDEVNNAQLVTVSRVNRHWNQVAQRLLYRQITLTNIKQLNLLVRTVDQVPSVASQIIRLSVPQQLRSDPARTHNAAGIRLSPEQLERERLQAQRAGNTNLLHLLSKLTALDSLTIHAKSIMLLVHSSEGSIKPPPLPNLVTIRKLNLIGLHDARWLFLLKHTTQVTNFRATPAWHSSDDPVLPFAKWDLQSLALTDGVRLSTDHFQRLVSSSSSSTPSRLRSLELINVPSLFTSFQFQPCLASLSPTLESLTISSSNCDELAQITKTLTSTLPSMSCLISLSTNAYRLRIISPILHSLRISLAQTPAAFYPAHTPRSSASTSPLNSPREPSHPIGTIYDTISGILDSISPPPPSPTGPSPTTKSRPQTASSPRTTLKKLTIIDAPMEDYLHFHLVGSDDWGDMTEAGKQNRLWMRAGQMGVLTVVEKAVQTDSSGRSSMGSSTA
ncbi:hypothetical protein FRC04_008103 [Tulasnella sp. 424]|nr:hypothetical protein FRC04_008103 [Tulasnella sp. 424]KAG8974760.1 hypothetical protein FRC05_006920 [Tulasnella sp. 425]